MTSWTISKSSLKLVEKHLQMEYEEADGTKSSPWDGVAGKFTPAGRFSIGGPKEVGHTVARALKDPTSAEGKKVRGA